MWVEPSAQPIAAGRWMTASTVTRSPGASVVSGVMRSSATVRGIRLPSGPKASTLCSVPARAESLSLASAVGSVVREAPDQLEPTASRAITASTSTMPSTASTRGARRGARARGASGSLMRPTTIHLRVVGRGGCSVGRARDAYAIATWGAGQLPSGKPCGSDEAPDRF